MPFITPYYECRLKACFQITKQALVNLHLEKVPSRILKKLESIKNENVRREVEFLNLLKAKIGNRETIRYSSLILKHAKISYNETYCVDVTLSAPPQTEPPLWVIDKLIGYFKIYKITDRILKKLRSKGLPDNVLIKLESIKNKKIETKKKFLNVLKETIGKEQTDRYKSLILEHVEWHRASNKICDFGAGKLRNARPFLEAGFTIYAVDYEKQFQYKKSQYKLEELKKDFPRRLKKLLPSDFGTKKKFKKGEFDAVLLIFVIHIIPSLRDRDLIIKICSEMLRENGLLVWVTPYGDTNMNILLLPQYRYRDGWILHAGTTSTRKTFYTEFRVAEIDKMVGKHGFELIELIDLHKNKARIYKKT